METKCALSMWMERIIEHIERLLLLHDCVIIPDFGGFVLQSVSAVHSDEEHSFTPARKEIVFNPTLTHNDGLLTESYMQKYAVDFQKAQQLVRKDVAEMKESLDDYSELQMGTIGFFVKEDERLIFMPGRSSDVLFSTQSYGLPVFHYLPLSARHPMMMAAVKAPAPTSETEPEAEIAPEKTEKQGKNVIYRIPVTRTFLRAVGAAAAAVLLFLFISTPVTDVNKASYSASFIPQEIMPKKSADDIVSDAFSTSSASASDELASNASDHSGYVAEVASPETKPANIETKTDAAPKPAASNASSTNSSASKAAETKVAETKPAETKPAETKASTAGGANYYVIIGSFNNRTQAQNYIKHLKGVDMGHVGILVRDGRVRVYAQGFATENAAQTYMNKLRQNPKHAQAWTYKAK